MGGLKFDEVSCTLKIDQTYHSPTFLIHFFPTGIALQNIISKHVYVYDHLMVFLDDRRCFISYTFHMTGLSAFIFIIHTLKSFTSFRFLVISNPQANLESHSIHFAPRENLFSRFLQIPNHRTIFGGLRNKNLPSYSISKECSIFPPSHCVPYRLLSQPQSR